MSISINNLTKIFGTQRAVDSISFSAKKGEITGFLGPNGAGKSTTMKMICALLDPDEGEILVNGIDVHSNPLKIKSLIGYLPEDNPLYGHMYVREFLQMMCGFHDISNPKSRIDELIKLTGLEKEEKKKISTLSKGYKQRMGLAHALLHDPDVLILDEPTSGLDPNQLAEIRTLIQVLGRNKTVMFSSHIMQEVQLLCDRVIIIDNGKIVANDTIENLQNANDDRQKIVLESPDLVSEKAILDISGVLEVSSLGEDRYEVICSTRADIRKKIYKLSVDKGFTILEMSATKINIENVFQKLTKRKS